MSKSSDGDRPVEQLRGAGWTLLPQRLSGRPQRRAELRCALLSWLTLGVTCAFSLLFLEDGRFNGVEGCTLIWDSAGISVAGKSPAAGPRASPEHSEPRALRPVLSSEMCFLASVCVFFFLNADNVCQ